MFNFTAFIRKKFAEYSQSRGQKGTVIDDLAVKPTALVMSDVYNIIVDQRRMNDISQWQTMTDEELNFFGNKFFIPRIDGDYASGVVRIGFDDRKNIELSSSVRFVSNKGLQYLPSETGYVSKNSFKVSRDSFSLYYIDIPIVASSKGDTYNVNAGEISQILNIDFTYKYVTNLEPIQYGTIYENNEAYYKRLIYSINDRSMANKGSLYVTLPNFFPLIQSMSVIAAGDPYMDRDLVGAVDLAMPINRADYLGKTRGNNIVKHIGFYEIFPPEPGSNQGSIWGPHSIKTVYNYPLVIEPPPGTFNPSDLNPLLSDPAFMGYALDQELSSDQYQGLFFDDYKTFLEVSSKDLFNIYDENVGFSAMIPTSGWTYGAHGMKNGNFGRLADDTMGIDVLNLLNNTINLAGGSYESLSVGKDILKRTGVKLTGSFVWPAVRASNSPTANSNLQLMVGGINSDTVDGYTGIGFGVRIIDVFDAENIDITNSIIYIAHSQKFDDGQVFANTNDWSTHTGVTTFGAMAEKPWRLEPGIEYEFEFILNDDLKVTLYINKTTNRGTDDGGNTFYFELPSSAFGIFNDILKVSTDKYGTIMKVTLDTKSMDKSEIWTINNLKAFDMCPRKATSLFAINLSDIDGPISVYLRAYGNSAINRSPGEGYQAFVWDTEAQSIASGSSDLSRGAWTELSDISNPNGTKNTTSTLIKQDIQNLDRYKINSKYGENMFIMVATSGFSMPAIKYSGNSLDDIQSLLKIDYVRVESQNAASYHANNKSDIYVCTVKNSQTVSSLITTLTKNSNESYFELSTENGFLVPIFEIVSVNIGGAVNTSFTLTTDQYNIAIEDMKYIGSAMEKRRIILDKHDADTITVEYRAYPDVYKINEFFKSETYGRVYGDVLARHKFPCNLSFTLFYTGTVGQDQLIKEIQLYVDNSADLVFAVRNLVNYLYNQKLVNGIREPIVVSYTKYDENYELMSGTFTDSLEIRAIDFFRLSNISVQQM